MSELNNLDSLLTLEEVNAVYNSNNPEEEAIFLLKKKCYELIEKNRKLKEQVAMVKKVIDQL